MKLDEMKLILDLGEGPNLEFKVDFPKQAHDIAKELVALANSGGGFLFLGVDDNGDAKGINNPFRAAERLANIARSCSPPLSPFIDKVRIDETRSVIYARVEHTPPCLYQGKVYVRVGSTSVECGGGDEMRRLLSISTSTATDTEYQTPAAEKFASSPLQIASIADVLSWGWDGIALLNRLIELDYQTISGLNEHNEGYAEQWAPVFMEHPDTWRLLIDGPETIVGYWHFVPLFPDEYIRARGGELLDGEITADKLCYVEFPGQYNIYFVSISLLPKYRGVRNFRLLLDALFDRFTKLARRNIFFNEVCANAFTPSGVSLCRTLEMKHVGTHNDHGELYVQDFCPLPNLKLFESYPDFVEAYSRAT